jgi:hypothetical protein
MIVWKYEATYLHTTVLILHFSISNLLRFHIFYIAQLVLKVTHPGDHHYKSFFLTKLYAVFIADRSTGLDKS